MGLSKAARSDIRLDIHRLGGIEKLVNLQGNIWTPARWSWGEGSGKRTVQPPWGARSRRSCATDFPHYPAAGISIDLAPFHDFVHLNMACIRGLMHAFVRVQMFIYVCGRMCLQMRSQMRPTPMAARARAALLACSRGDDSRSKPSPRTPSRLRPLLSAKTQLSTRLCRSSAPDRGLGSPGGLPRLSLEATDAREEGAPWPAASAGQDKGM